MVRITAKALVTIASEPSRSHARDLVIIGHLLASRLKRDGAISADSDFALVWRDAVVPIAAASRHIVITALVTLPLPSPLLPATLAASQDRLAGGHVRGAARPDDGGWPSF